MKEYVYGFAVGRMNFKVNIKYNIGCWYRLYYRIINILIVKIMPGRLLCDRFVPKFGFA